VTGPRLKGHRGLRILPSATTVLAICAGLTSIKFALDGRPHVALALIGAAAVLDGIDGGIARALDAQSRMGAEIDSLADAVNFGVAPALVVYVTLLPTSPIGWICVLLYAVCVVLRLARFNALLAVAVGERPTPAEMEETFGIAVDLDALLPADVAVNALLHLNDPAARAIGVPGGGGVMRAADLALVYQGFLHNPGAMWSEQVLAAGTAEARVTLPDWSGVPSNRTLGLILASDDGFADRRSFGRTASGRAFDPGGSPSISLASMISSAR